MQNSAEALRRWLGLFSLAVAAGMLIWGQTILKPVLKDIGFVIYWGICFFFTISAIVIALLDVRAVRQRIKAEQAELLAKTMQEIEENKKAKPAQGDEEQPV